MSYRIISSWFANVQMSDIYSPFSSDPTCISLCKMILRSADCYFIDSKTFSAIFILPLLQCRSLKKNRTRYPTSTESNHPPFLCIINIRRKFHFYFAEQNPICVLPWTLKSQHLQIKDQSLSILHILIIFTS